MSEAPEPKNETVVVTGISGFIGAHCALACLREGYRVVGTLRTPGRVNSVRSILHEHASFPDQALEFRTLDLMKDTGWDDAMQGARYLLHVASPIPNKPPKDENELIVPARQGTERAIRAAKRAGIERVVLTSSVAAVFSGLDPLPNRPFDERDWSDLERTRGAYPKSKTIAERTAWDLVNGECQGLELAAINPVVVLGPILEKDFSVSGEAVKKLLDRQFPACPKIGFTLVDARDVASAHLLAMTHPEAAGERFITGEEFFWMREIAAVLNEHFPDLKLPLWELPNFVMRLVALFDDVARIVVGDLGVEKRISHQKLVKLGWQPRPARESIVALAESLIRYGVCAAPPGVRAA